MSATFARAYDQALALFVAAWQPTTFLALYPDKPGDPPPDAAGDLKPWARVSYELLASDQRSFGRPGGQSVKFGRRGLLQVQVFTPGGDGMLQAQALTKLVVDAYEGFSTSDLWFLNVYPQKAIPSGPWLMTTVVAEFEFEELK